MCGIAGIVDFNNTTGIDTVKSMLQSISYRGPDECGIFHSRHVTMGNVRLSIIDLLSGQQPLSDISDRYWIIFNGEIFNYLELRQELEKDGIRLRTRSDTEVLVQLYARYGKECLNKLNGQFAFAIWDTLSKELFIARDRVGIRPLFYNVTGGVFSFASEIKALFQQRSVKREFHAEGLAQVFTFWTALTPDTAFKDVYELSPGHYLIYNREGLKIGKYWELDFMERDEKLSFGEAVEQLDELLSSAVRLRLRADVEVAAYLSGGIDSSATVRYIKDIEPRVLNTFSIGFEDKVFDETSYQEDAVRYLDTDHRAVTCSSLDIARHFPGVIWHSETPVTRTAPTPMMILSRLVRDNNIKVVITGEGSDEMLAGYDIFREGKIRRFWASQPGSSIRPLLLKKIYPDIPHLHDASPAILKMFFGYKLDDVSNPFYSHLLRWNNSNHIKKHFSAGLKQGLLRYSPLEQLESRLPAGFDSWNALARSQWLETTIFMSGYLLSSQGDRMSMANSVEGRYPFLDYRVIEFCAGLPEDYKLKGLNEKFILKKLMQDKIPERIIERPKQPYRAPISSAFMSEGAPDYVNEMLSADYTGRVGIFNVNTLQPLYDRVTKTGTASEMDNMVLAAVISTHLLHHQFIENHSEEFHAPDLKNLKIVEDIN